MANLMAKSNFSMYCFNPNVETLSELIRERREILLAFGENYRPPSYECSLLCIDQHNHLEHIKKDIGERHKDDACWKCSEFNKKVRTMMFKESSAAYITKTMLMRKMIKGAEDKAGFVRFKHALDGPYGIGETPSAEILHFLLLKLTTYEPGLVFIIVNMLFSRFFYAPYAQMHQDSPHTRAYCQLFIMFRKYFFPKEHRTGLTRVITSKSEHDRAKRSRIIKLLKPIKTLGI